MIYSMEVGGGYVLLESRRAGAGWTAPRLLPFSGRWSDAEAALSPDGRVLVFASKRPRADSAARTDYDLWMVDRTAGGSWGEPRPLDALSTTANELYPSLTRDGTLYFTRSSPDGSDLWRAEGRGGGYTAPVPVAEINTDRRESSAWVDAAERVMLFESNRAGSLGGNDLFVSCRTGGAWGPPRRLDAPGNSADHDGSGVLSPDGRTLYFTSNRRTPAGAVLGHGTTYPDLLRRLRAPGNGRWHTYEMPVPFDC
ncbi:MAG TPA: hypothetical protein VEX86_23110 [Longimicrobium sp.]|nr:hypothetical protein [Longimicrobium sp.]